MQNKKLNIGLFGFGCVGKGLYEVLQLSENVNAGIRKICVKDRHKKRSIDYSHFTYGKNELLNDPEINLIVELIDNADEAFQIVKEAITKGKAVVTANKKMLAEHFEELYQLQQTYKVPLLYEASVCASIPIIRTLEEYYDNDLLSSIEGIFNGTTNYILTKMFDENLSYSEALEQSKDAGYAESNPRLDVEGYDPKYKLSILIAHAFGLIVKPEDMLNIGINRLRSCDIRFAREKGYKIKLIAKAYKDNNSVIGYVMPKLVKREDELYGVNNEFNAVQVEAAFNDKQFFKGKGAGSYPTAAAVLSDISALTYGYRYGYKKLWSGKKPELKEEEILKVYIRYTNDRLTDRLNLIQVHEQFISHENKYLIASVRLTDLMDSGIRDEPEVFIMKMDLLNEEKTQNSFAEEIEQLGILLQ